MKVKLLVSRGGPGISQNAGDTVDVGDAEGIRMIEAGQAVPVSDEKTETAVLNPASDPNSETATKQPPTTKTETATKKKPTQKAVKG